MSGELRRGDLVWTTEQLYGIVEAIRGDELLVFLGNGRHVALPLERVIGVRPDGSLASEHEDVANFGALLGARDQPGN